MASVYIFFKPLNIKQHIYGDVPLFELQNFTMYELDTNGLDTLMRGSKAIRYSNRYIIDDMDYTDNSREFMATMKANHSVYKDDIVTLNGNVEYARADGLKFDTQKAIYNKKSSQAISDVGYTAYFDDSVVKGSYIRYNNRTNEIFSKNVDATIQLQEGK